MRTLCLVVGLFAVMMFCADAADAHSRCQNCHTPHHATTEAEDPAAFGIPLWNSPNSELDWTTFTLYSSDTMNATPGQPDGSAKVCLGCHDGTYAGIAEDAAEGEGANFGHDLSNMHPISFVYDTALATADGELQDPATAASKVGAGVAGSTGATSTIDHDLLDKYNHMQCVSCHDPHSATAIGEAGLRWNILESSDLVAPGVGVRGMCRVCHKK